MRGRNRPAATRRKFAVHREQLHQPIKAAKPVGGTAYLDATSEGLRHAQGHPGRRAVVLMTDGVDMNSKRTQQQVIEQAQGAGCADVHASASANRARTSR